MAAADVDILLGLCLMQSRRFLQAAEIFRKVAYVYYKRAHLDKENSDQLLLMSSGL